MCKEPGYTFTNAVYNIQGVYTSAIFFDSAITLTCKYGSLAPSLFVNRTAWCDREFGLGFIFIFIGFHFANAVTLRIIRYYGTFSRSVSYMNAFVRRARAECRCYGGCQNIENQSI